MHSTIWRRAGAAFRVTESMESCALGASAHPPPVQNERPPVRVLAQRRRLSTCAPGMHVSADQPHLCGSRSPRIRRAGRFRLLTFDVSDGDIFRLHSRKCGDLGRHLCTRSFGVLRAAQVCVARAVWQRRLYASPSSPSRAFLSRRYGRAGEGGSPQASFLPPAGRRSPHAGPGTRTTGPPLCQEPLSSSRASGGRTFSSCAVVKGGARAQSYWDDGGCRLCAGVAPPVLQLRHRCSDSTRMRPQQGTRTRGLLV
ncbi:hypothetical protein MRX96_031063 [Rhipicephalus microplus]